jgi:CubicO group peptidase (beta-lactamase class C family)
MAIRHSISTWQVVGVTAVWLSTTAQIAAQAPQEFDSAWQYVAAEYRQRLNSEGIVGSSLWFLKDGEVLAREFHGLADLDTQRPVDEHTIYHWASITKTFTGIAIMQLRDRGLLSLDDPIIDFLPELRNVHNPFGSMGAITVRHLLSHSSGFRMATWPWGGAEPWHPHEPTSWDQIVAMIPYTEILFEPGSRYSYSNPGIIFLGRIIEQLSGDDYEVYIDKNILKPLRMYDTYFDRTPYHLLQYRSNNYYVEDGRISANGLDFDTGITVSNGGLNAPITDMVKYLAFLAGAPARQMQYDRILRRASLEEMWQPAVEVGVDSASGTQSHMGLAYFLLEHGDLRVIGHTGGQKGFISFFYVDPLTGAAAIAANNTLGVAGAGDLKPDTRRVMAEVQGLLFERVFPLFEPR